MSLLKKNKPAPAVEPEETAVEGVTREEFDALQAQVTELTEKLDSLIAELNSAPAVEPEPDPAAEPETTPEAGADETPADEGEIQIPTEQEITDADDAQLKAWRQTLFDAADAKKPLEEIRKELLEVSAASAAGNSDPAPTDDPPADDAPADDDPAPTKGKGTNGNVFGLIQDKKTKLISNEEMKPISACTTDKDKVIRLANTYACFFDEKACKCKTGDKKAIAECWKEYLNDPETKKALAKEKAKPAAPAKKPLLKRK